MISIFSGKLFNKALQIFLPFGTSKHPITATIDDTVVFDVDENGLVSAADVEIGDLNITGTLTGVDLAGEDGTSIVYAGLWNENTTYSYGEWVRYVQIGRSYVYINSTPSSGHNLDDITYWATIAEDGVDADIDEVVPYVGATKDVNVGVRDLILTAGTELVPNGTFTGNADGWTLGTLWTYGSNRVAKGVGVGGNLVSSAVLVPGDRYTLSFDYGVIINGSLVVSGGGWTETYSIPTSGSLSVSFTATTAAPLTFNVSNNFGLSYLDNVSLKHQSGDIYCAGDITIGDGLSGATQTLTFKPVGVGEADGSISFTKNYYNYGGGDLRDKFSINGEIIELAGDVLFSGSLLNVNIDADFYNAVNFYDAVTFQSMAPNCLYGINVGGNPIALTDTARVKHNLIINLAGFGRGAAKPNEVIENCCFGYEFSLDDLGYFNFEVPLDWDDTTDLKINIHWYINEAYATRSAEVQWACIYTATNEDSTEDPTVSGTTVKTGDVNIPATAKYLIESSMVIPASELAIDDVVCMQIKRVALVGGTNPTDEPTIISMELVYTANRIGGALDIE